MAKRVLKANEVLKDLRSGLTDAAMMEKYQLSSKGLQSLFDKMVAAGLLSAADVADRMSTWVDSVVVDLADLK